MTKCPILLDENPPCLKLCSVEGEYHSGIGEGELSSMLSDCINSLVSWEELELTEILEIFERMVLLLRSKTAMPRELCEKMVLNAQETFEAISEIEDPILWKLYLRIGDIRLTCGKPASAVEAYTESVLMKDDEPEVWNNLGLARKKMGNAEDAVASYKKAIEIDDRYPQAWFNLGMVHFEEGDLTEGRNAFLKAVKLDPDNPVAFNNLAVIMRKEGRPHEALKLVNKAIELLPDYARAWHNKGIALIDSGQEEQGTKCLIQALKFDPDSDETRTELKKLGFDPDTIAQNL